MEKQETSQNLSSAPTLVELTTASITEKELKIFIAKQIQIWNDTDPVARLVKMNEIYLENISFFDHEGTVSGINELNERITQLQHKFQGLKFSLDKIDNSYNVVRYYWNYGPASNSKLISGMDLIILEQGKIRSLHVFVDHLPE